ncbi:hypothetical protein RVR_4489 [Actinacidiphila reveromycinica]|uniref:Uncharacterized protein n=1 Tax=Actinacidiphila reveromycinica TaxID=659352 RepID=A0A7U3VP50_9ACTN|nr:hypothetical protein [Streptomyces sp. SN-593]BBA98345.1 hypothetical protein RVR_4489 [Streptomyces sp. SN-593]
MSRPPGTAASHRPWTAFVLHAATPEASWCAVCKAWTCLTVGLLLLTPDGISTVGTRTWCEICDDTDHPLPPRRIDRG